MAKKALLIGINYFSSKYELNGCINDVKSLKSKLELLKFDKINTLTDDKDYKPTKINILVEFRKLLEESNDGDILFFSFSGHGSNTIDRNGDEEDGFDEMLITSDMNGILDGTINDYISTYLNNKKVTLFCLIDCCHSGSIMDLKYQYLDSNNYNKTIENKKINNVENSNIIMISGCKDNQTSADACINKKYQGAMTWSFLRVLSIYPNLNLKNLVQNMRNILRLSNYTQIPQLSSNKLIDLERSYFFRCID